MDAGIGDEVRHRVGADEQRGEQTGRAAGPVPDVGDGQGTTRHVRGVFEHGTVAGQQRGWREAEHLPERIVPGHDCQDEAQRVEGDVAAGGPGCHGLVHQ